MILRLLGRIAVGLLIVAGVYVGVFLLMQVIV